MSPEMITGTLSSYKIDAHTGHRVAPRRAMMHNKQQIVCGVSCLHSKSQEGSPQTSQISSSKCQDLQWTHDTDTPHRSETNGIAERAVRRVKDGQRQRWPKVWLTQTILGLCDGMLLLFVRENTLGAIIRWTLDLVRSQCQLQADLTASSRSLRNVRHGCLNLADRCFPTVCSSPIAR